MLRISKRLIASFCLAVPLLTSAGAEVKLARVPEHGLQPQALVTADGIMHLVYLAGDPAHCDVFYTKRLVGGTNFSRPIRVNSIPGSAIAVGTVRGAQLATGKNGRINVAWNGSDRASTSDNGSAPMLYSRMNDTGTEFEPQRNLMTSTTHLDGGGSVAADDQGHVYVIWHAHRKTGPQEEIDRGVFVACSTNDGRTFVAERQVNPSETGACGCCGLKAFAANGGLLTILYRSANLSGNRDTVVLLSTNYGDSFSTTVLGQWHAATCPMSTYALGRAQTRVFGMWETAGQVCSGYLNTLDLSVNRAASSDASSGNCKHPAFAVSEPSKTMLLAWTEGTGWEKGGILAWKCLDSHGLELAAGRTEGVPVWGSVAAVAEPDGSFTVLF